MPTTTVGDVRNAWADIRDRIRTLVELLDKLEANAEIVDYRIMDGIIFPKPRTGKCGMDRLDLRDEIIKVGHLRDTAAVMRDWMTEVLAVVERGNPGTTLPRVGERV